MGRDRREAWQPMLEGRGARVVLPPRGLPLLRGIGAALVAFGALFCGALLLVSASFWWPGARGSGPGLMGLLFPLTALVSFGGLAALGLLVGFGHGELIVTDDEVIGRDRCGPVRITRRVAIADLERLAVGGSDARVNGRPVESGPWSDLAILQAERRPGAGQKRGVLLVIGYPRAEVEALAEEVRARIGRDVDIEQRFADSRTPRSEPTPLPDQPGQSGATVVRTADGLSLELPALGFFRGSKGLGCFSLAWLGFVVIFSGSVPMLLLMNERGTILLPFAGVTLLFGAIGVVIFRSALRSGRRRAIIEVAGGKLTIVTQSLGAPQSYSWERARLRQVVAGPTGVSINERPVLELQIVTESGKKVGLLRERSDDELVWIASELTAALGLER